LRGCRQKADDIIWLWIGLEYASFCPQCGQALTRSNKSAMGENIPKQTQVPMTTIAFKSKGIAMLLEFFIPGVGAIYIDHKRAGITWLLMAILGLPAIFNRTLFMIVHFDGNGPDATQVLAAFEVGSVLATIFLTVRLIYVNRFCQQRNVTPLNS
jgi:TM2 domain-containing membrane protein YozV